MGYIQCLVLMEDINSLILIHIQCEADKMSVSLFGGFGGYPFFGGWGGWGGFYPNYGRWGWGGYYPNYGRWGWGRYPYF